MGFRHIASVMAARMRPSREKLVLLCLADYASDEDGQCWPAIRSLSAKTELSERAIQQSLKKLADMGLITIRRRSVEGMSLTNIYRLDLNAITARHASPSLRKDTAPSRKRDGGRAGGGARPAPGVVQTMREGGAYPAPEPVMEPVNPEPIASSLRSEVVGSAEPTQAATSTSGLTSKRSKNDYPTDFLEFWAGYPTDPNMSKRETFKAWKRITTDERSQALAALPAFRAHCLGDPTYRPVHACRFLSQRRAEGFLDASRPAGHVPPFGDDRTFGEMTGPWDLATVPATIANILKGNPATHSDYVLAKRLAPFIGLWFVRPLFAHVADPALDPEAGRR
ncbi:helix-turn-helix domain-containing protein [Pleomorphomonas sp. PLEO]|uniref:helix-turn-helix domain-containing protein n=1 Tax=Pleomorphomonas sp. PLEO TaxID=3239306 RepID=UPI00351F45AD